MKINQAKLQFSSIESGKFYRRMISCGTNLFMNRDCVFMEVWKCVRRGSINKQKLKYRIICIHFEYVSLDHYLIKWISSAVQQHAYLFKCIDFAYPINKHKETAIASIEDCCTRRCRHRFLLLLLPRHQPSLHIRTQFATNQTDTHTYRIRIKYVDGSQITNYINAK